MKYESKEVYSGKGDRVDKYLSEEIFEDISRSKIQNLLKKGLILVNGEIVKKNQNINSGDKLTWNFETDEEINILPVDLGIECIYEDDYIYIINKPRGIVVHPAESVKDPTVISDLIFRNVPLAPVSSQRPGVVHRIDRYTSGIVIFVKTIDAYERFVDMFKEKKLVKKYCALCYNNFKNEEGIINMPIARSLRDRKKMCVKAEGKEAITIYKEIERFDGFSLVDVNIRTGRTHQIRVHLAHVGHPVVGDDVYGPDKNGFGLVGQFLHAYYIAFKHPFTGEKMEFIQKMPEDLTNVLKELGYEKNFI
ncbi:MAG: RluA family pseudouridine synthase [Candidatus Muirbacterium halophilum]|nr:RluA family pseudouridine synthase [Candidatus Muirbacterium halophilum]MCK9475360.1 RluA family pseudouridine synthase [Candidatus Muirbacterium halophilum]